MGASAMPKPDLDPIARIYLPFEDYIVHLVPLMVFHLWQLKTTSGKPASEHLSEMGWLRRLVLSQIDDGQKDSLTHMIDNCASPEAVGPVEAEALAMFVPMLKPHFQEGYRFPEREFHCWWYDVSEEDTLVSVHLVNADQPNSPFDNRSAFVGDLRRALLHAKGRFPAIRTVRCGSWLNSFDRFLEIWPASYQESRAEFQSTGGVGPGVWGQYMNARGGFNHKTAAVLRQTGRHPYALSLARCPFAEVLDHQAAFLA